MRYVRKNGWLGITVIVFGITGWSMFSGTNIYIQRLVDLIADGDTGGFVQMAIYAALFMACTGMTG